VRAHDGAADRPFDDDEEVQDVAGKTSDELRDEFNAHMTELAQRARRAATLATTLTRTGEGFSPTSDAALAMFKQAVEELEEEAPRIAYTWASVERVLGELAPVTRQELDAVFGGTS
jgi:hypothetical protein